MVNTRVIILTLLAIIAASDLSRGAVTWADAELARLLESTSHDAAPRVQKLKVFAESHPGAGAAADAQLIAGLALLKTEAPGAEKEAVDLFKQVMKQRRGTWREAVATVSMVNALHVSGQHESVRELSEYSLKNGILDKLNSGQDEMTAAVKAELDFDPHFYHDVILVMLALAHESLKEPEEARRIFERITHPRILQGYPNGIGQSLPPKSTPAKTAEPPAHSTKSPVVPKLKPSPMAQSTQRTAAPNEETKLSPADQLTLPIPWIVIGTLIVAAAGLFWLWVTKPK